MPLLFSYDRRKKMKKTPCTYCYGQNIFYPFNNAGMNEKITLRAPLAE